VIFMVDKRRKFLKEIQIKEDEINMPDKKI
jgi:hypothetical protein